MQHFRNTAIVICFFCCCVFQLASISNASGEESRTQIGNAAVGRDPASDSIRVVGYLPEYRAAEFDFATAKGLTDLILFSAFPASDGSLDLGRLRQKIQFDKFRAFKTRERVRLVLCVGGAERSANFAPVATSPLKRKKFAETAVRICLGERLDGLDLDWEHPKNLSEQESYGKLLQELREAFKPHGLLLSVTIAGWQKLSTEAFSAVDTVNLMAYDYDGRHSTIEGVQSDLKLLANQGVPAKKTVLGVPFYGRHLKNRHLSLTYREIVAKHQLAPHIDEVDGFYFNGPETIRLKTRLALESGLAGVMVWELGQDVSGQGSLLRVIQTTIRDSHIP